MAGPGSHPTVGLSLASPVSRHVVPVVDLGFTPLGNRAFRPDFASRVNRSNLFELTGGAHLRWPISSAFAPYLTVGAGLLHTSSDVVVGQNMGTMREGDNHFAFSLGAGARYYMSRKWGVRPELKFYSSKRDFGRLSIGFFYQFP